MSIFENPQEALLRTPVYGVIVGQYLGMSPQQQPLVVFPGQAGTDALMARTITDLRGTEFGAEVLLQFDQGDVSKPIILGVLQNPQDWSRPATHDQPVALEVDGERKQIEAREQLVLRCGEASITLTRAGKVLIKGTYLSSRATGTHRIKGGSVQIN